MEPVVEHCSRHLEMLPREYFSAVRKSETFPTRSEVSVVRKVHLETSRILRCTLSVYWNYKIRREEHPDVQWFARFNFQTLHEHVPPFGVQIAERCHLTVNSNARLSIIRGAPPVSSPLITMQRSIPA